ncbi:SMC5-SMC6 complex localization factor protein 2-like [Melanerpes formicivorus]|uniref:SMC5-SMC6 complex localization factor protein 2-like n=1 Tax=Melanerpes formicivorus TaxID=211600 RepID=UPI00358EB766
MTWPLSVGVPSPGSPVIGSRRHFTPAATARAMAQDFRNKTITEFFKPILNQDLGHKDRTVLCSPDRGNIRDAGIGLSVQHFEKKIPSPKVRRKKMPDQIPNTSPVVGAFWRGRKEGKGHCKHFGEWQSMQGTGFAVPKSCGSKTPLVTTGSRCYFLAKKDKTVKSEQGRNEKCLGATSTPLSCGNSWEQQTDYDPPQPKQVSKHEASSPSALKTSPEMTAGIWKSQSVSPCCLRFKMSSGRSKQLEFPGKRKRTAVNMDADHSSQSEVSSFSDKAFSRSSAKCKNRKPNFVKTTFLKSTCGDVLQLMEAGSLPRHDSALPEEYLNSSDKSEKNNCSVSLSSSYPTYSPAKNNHISVVDTKENQLQVANSRFFLEKSLPFSQEKSTLLPSLHHLTQTKGTKPQLQNAALPQVLDTSYKKEQDGKRPERHAHNKAYSIQFSNSSSKTIEKTSENASVSCSVEGSGKPAFSEETGKGAPSSLPFKECMDSGHLSSQLSGELQVESTCTDKSKLNGRSKSSFDSEDENLECSLDDDDDSNEEEVVFVPLHEILSSSPKPQGGTLEELCLDSFGQDTMNPLLKLHLSKPPVDSQVSYVNSLEHLLKEKEESKRIDELEKQLLEDMQGGETDSSDGEDKENDNGDEDLSEEHSSPMMTLTREESDDKCPLSGNEACDKSHGASRAAPLRCRKPEKEREAPLPAPHTHTPGETPCGDGCSPSGMMDSSCPGAPGPWKRGLVGMGTEKEAQMSEGLAIGSRLLHPGQREEGGDMATVKHVTRRQMSPPPSAAA